MHLTNFGIKNFRIFKEEQYLELAPITLLTGPNNSGKSSYIKALLLLKDSFKIKTGNSIINELYNNRIIPEFIFENIPTELVFNDDSAHGISSFDSALNNTSGKAELQFILPFVIPDMISDNIGELILLYKKIKDGNRLKELTVRINNIVFFRCQFNYSSGKISRTDYNLNYKFIIEQIEKSNIQFAKPNRFKIENGIMGFPSGREIVVSMNELTISASPRNINDGLSLESSLKDFGITEYVKGLMKPELNNIIGPYFENGQDEKKFYSENPELYQNLLDLEDGFLNHSFNNKGLLTFTSKSKVFTASFSSAFENCIKDFLEQRKINLGKAENQIINSLYLSKYGALITGIIDRAIKFNFEQYSDTLKSIKYIPNPVINFENLINKNNHELYKLVLAYNNITEISNKRIRENWGYLPFAFLSTILQALNIGDRLLNEKIKEYGFEISVEKNGLKIPMKEMGYGIRKLVSIILNITVAVEAHLEGDGEKDWFNPGIIILEEPESNLHPKLQSLLADILFWAANVFNVQFVVETHSEYLIRKIQYMVASREEEHAKLEARHIAIFYFKDGASPDIDKEQVYELGLRPDGILRRDFGPGFFDESLNLAASLLKMQNLN